MNSMLNLVYNRMIMLYHSVIYLLPLAEEASRLQQMSIKITKFIIQLLFPFSILFKKKKININQKRIRKIQ